MSEQPVDASSVGETARHYTEVRALRQTFPVIRCIGRILHATDVTHPNLAFLPGHTRRRGVFLGWRPHTTHVSWTRHVSNAVMSWREATSTGVNFRRPCGMESSIPIAQANVNCRLPPIRAISPLRASSLSGPHTRCASRDMLACLSAELYELHMYSVVWRARRRLKSCG